MSFLGTFDGFTTSRLAIIAAQTGLNVTGNNIANISTKGYTRQVLDQVSLKTGGNDRYASVYQLHMGTGVLCTGISQIRDPYLDIRYRTEMSSVGANDTWLAGLNDIASILDEVGKGENDGDGLIMAQISDLCSALNDLNTEAGQEVFDNLVRTSASTLCTLFKKYADKLETLKNNTEVEYQQKLSRVNEILTGIQELNASIRRCDIHGDNALEMRDTRNLLIDELSEYMQIDVIYDEEDLGGGDTVERLTIRLGNANPQDDSKTDDATLIHGIYAVQFASPEVMPQKNDNYDSSVTDPYMSDPNDPDNTIPNPKYGMYLKADGTGTNDITEAASEVDANNDEVDNDYYNLFLTELKDLQGRVMQEHGKDVPPTGQLDDNDLFGRLQSYRELLTEKGEFATQDEIDNIDEGAATKRGIPFYQKALDLLANQIATALNKANQGYAVDQDGNYLTTDGEVLQLAGEPINQINGLTDDQKQELIDNGYVDEDGAADLEAFLKDEDNEAWFLGGNLFSNSSDGDDDEPLITASNISISHSWSIGDIHVVPTFTKLFGGELEDSTQDSNIQYMVTLFETDMLYDPTTIDKDAASTYLFKGSFQEMLDRIGTDLGEDQRSTQVVLNNHYGSSVELDASRDNVAGVDLNDETMNMMQYQKALTAAYRLLTVLDEALDKLISNTGVVGR